MVWAITRQSQWLTGNHVVEISFGDINLCNPDALCEEYPGEFKEFADPREAVEAAIQIAHSWQVDEPSREILIDYGCTSGMTIPFEGYPLTEETFSNFRDWANTEYEGLEKCSWCRGVLPEPENRWGNRDLLWDEEFCSENCCNRGEEWKAFSEQEVEGDFQ